MSIMPRLHRQPLFWFLSLGGLLFVVDEFYSVERNEIYVSIALQERIAALWQTQTGLVPSNEELSSLLANWVEEEVLYQEALRLGLDQEDTIIRRRLVQKINFVAESEAIPEPETSVLRAFYDESIRRYTLPPRFSFRQLYFRDIASAENAQTVSGQGREIVELGEISMLSSDYAYRSALDLNTIFGIGFADGLVGLSTDNWQGPVESSFGFHLVYITAKHPEEITPFASVAQQVRLDYLEIQKGNVKDDFLRDLLDDYVITVEAR